MLSEAEEAIPNFSAVKLTQGFLGFVSKIGLIVGIWDFFYKLMTLEDTKFSVTCFTCLSFTILYFEHALILFSLLPLCLIAFILTNLQDRNKFPRPANTYVRNMKFVQGLINLISDWIELAYDLIQDYFYWRNQYKTMVMLNCLLVAPFGIWALVLVMPVIPIRHLLAAAVWTPAIV